MATPAAARGRQFGADLKLEDPKDFVPVFEHCKMGTELMGKQQYAEATRELQEAVQQRPKLVLGHYFLGQIAARQWRPADAKRELTTALSILADSKGATTSAGEAKRMQTLQCR